MQLIDSALDGLWLGMVERLLQDGMPQPSRDGDSIEQVGVTLRLTDIRRNFVYHPGRKASAVYAAAELLWYLSGTKDDRMVAYAPQFRRFLNGNEAFGGYGFRWQHGGTDFQELWSEQCQHEHLGDVRRRTQLAALIELLQRKPETRQAVLSAWQSPDLLWALMGGKNDLPCTLSIQFLVRQGRLHAITTMRSNDVWLGVPYDVFAMTTLQRMIADALGLKYGEYVHNVGSMHLYTRDKKKAEAVLAMPAIPYRGPNDFKQTKSDRIGDFISAATVQEKRTRIQGKYLPLNPDVYGTVMGDLYALAACQFDPEAVKGVSCDNLKSMIPAKKLEEYRP